MSLSRKLFFKVLRLIEKLNLSKTLLKFWSPNSNIGTLQHNKLIIFDQGSCRGTATDRTAGFESRWLLGSTLQHFWPNDVLAIFYFRPISNRPESRFSRRRLNSILLFSASEISLSAVGALRGPTLDQNSSEKCPTFFEHF